MRHVNVLLKESWRGG